MLCLALQFLIIILNTEANLQEEFFSQWTKTQVIIYGFRVEGRFGIKGIGNYKGQLGFGTIYLSALYLPLFSFYLKFASPNQGLLELLWTVYSEGKLQSCLKLRNFQNPFNNDESVYGTYHVQKRPKICPKSYLYHNTKIVKPGPAFDDPPAHPSI